MTDEQKKAFAEKMAAARAKAKAEKTGEVSGTPDAAPLTEADVPVVDTAEEETSDPVVATEEAKDQEVEAELAQPAETVSETPVSEVPAQEEAPAPEVVDDGSVLLRSADNRSLQASIGESVWEGKEIRVPAHQAKDVRNLLENGGFFLKD